MSASEAIGDVCFEHPHVAPFDGVGAPVFVPGRDDFTQGGQDDCLVSGDTHLFGCFGIQGNDTGLGVRTIHEWSSGYLSGLSAPMVFICHVVVYTLRFRDLVYRMHQYAFCSVHRRGMFTALEIAEWGRARRIRKSRIGVCDGAYVQDLWEVLSSERFVMTLVSFRPEYFYLLL